MPYCKACKRIMDKKTTIDSVKFICPGCSDVTNGTPEDTLIYSNITSKDNKQMFAIFQKNVVEDPTNQRVLRNCPKCPMPCLCLIRVKENDSGTLVCRCGHVEEY